MAESLSDLRNPVVVVAFQGWNDASDAATNAVNHLGMVYDAETVFEIDGEDYYDFQVNRPQISFVDGIEREIEWPSVKVSVAALGDRDIVLVSGPGVCSSDYDLFRSPPRSSPRCAASSPRWSSSWGPCSPTRRTRAPCR